jgi:hypothetical protein
MKIDQPTIDGVIWGAQYMTEHPSATWVELQANRIPGIKLWKGMMGAIRHYQQTGEVYFPAAERVKEPTKKTDADEPIIPALCRRIEVLYGMVEKLQKRLDRLGTI